MLFSPAHFLPTEITAGYQGPGDIVSGAFSWWGLRGYNAAYSTGNNPCMDVVDTATGLITTTCNINAEGNLAVNTILSLGYAVSVKKLYDQTGNGHHLLQATLANMPTITLSGLGSLPIMVFGGSKVLTESGTSALPTPSTISAVNKTAVLNSITWQNAVAFLYHDASIADKARMFLTGSFNATASDSAFHALLAVFNVASSHLYVDGTDTAGAVGSPFGTSAQQIGSATNILEVGVWGSALTAGNATSLSTNQHTYWGF